VRACFLDCGALAAEDQLARILGPEWQTMRYGKLADRAHQLKQAASFTRTLARYMGETEAETAGEALERLQAANASGANIP
jgi:hypothetical protein